MFEEIKQAASKIFGDDGKKMQQVSPTPKENKSNISSGKKMMSFSDAVNEVFLSNIKITKSEWNNKNIYGFTEGGLLKLHKDDGKSYDWIISDGDFLGKDWIII